MSFLFCSNQPLNKAKVEQVAVKQAVTISAAIFCLLLDEYRQSAKCYLLP